MKEINIKIEKNTKMVFLPNDYILIDGENLQNKLVFEFIDEFVNGQARLEFVADYHKNYIVMNKGNNIYSLPVKSLITKAGKVDMQLVIDEKGEYKKTRDTIYKDKKEYYSKNGEVYTLLIKGTDYKVGDEITGEIYIYTDIPTFKSKSFFVTVEPSINAVDEVPPEGYEDWITHGNAKLNLMDEALEKVDNLNISAERVEDGVEISITDKEGQTTTTKVNDGQDGGTSDYNNLSNKPKINNIELEGNKSLNDLGIQPAGEYITDNNYVHTDNNYTSEEKTKLSELNNYDDTELKQDIADLEEIKADKSEIPDVSNFITKSVNDLINYYLKSETYSKTEVNNLISAIEKATFQVVSELPETGESNVIYLVPTSNPKMQNVKDEFIWINENWEQIGNTQVDLTGYATETWVTSQISDFLTQNEITNLITTILANYYTKSELATLLYNKADKSSLNNYISKSTLAQTTGSATNNAMSQKGVTDALEQYLPLIGGILTGALTLGGTSATNSKLLFNRPSGSYIQNLSGGPINIGLGEIAGAANSYRFLTNAFVFGTSNEKDIGTSSLLWRNVYTKSVKGLSTPTQDDEATNKAYVDSKVGDSSLVERVRGKNLLDSKSWQTGGYYGSNGRYYENADGIYQFVELNGAGTYQTFVDGKFFGLTSALKLPLFDENGTFVKAVTGTTSETTETHYNSCTFTITDTDINDGVKYVVVSRLKLYTDRVMVVKSDTPLDYNNLTYLTYCDYKKFTDMPINNPLAGKLVVFDGDSICEGKGSAKGKYGLGWASRIGIDNKMDWYNFGISGGTITNITTEPVHCVSTSIDEIHSKYPNLDYLILEGGTNDADKLGSSYTSEKFGTLDIADFSGNYDNTTYTGALDSLFYKATQYFPKAKIGFIIAHKMGVVNGGYIEEYSNRYRYFIRAMEVCKKWGIPFINLWDNVPFNPRLAQYWDGTTVTASGAEAKGDAGYMYYDGQHLTWLAYDYLSPIIAEWMKSMYSSGGVDTRVDGLEKAIDTIRGV